MVAFSTGCKCIDSNIDGGIAPRTVTLIYGEPETGKTTLAIQCAVNCALQDNKVLYVDCDGTFSTQRLSQISAKRFEQVAEKVNLVRPKVFSEQIAVLDNIQNYVERNFGLIVVDTLTSLYGAEVAEHSGKAFNISRELNRQLANLAQTAKLCKIPVIITSQVRNVLDNPSVGVAPVANRVLKFWADNIIALKPTDYPQIIKVVIEKTRENQQEVNCYVQIVEAGIKDTQFEE